MFIHFPSVFLIARETPAREASTASMRVEIILMYLTIKMIFILCERLLVIVLRILSLSSSVFPPKADILLQQAPPVRISYHTYDQLLQTSLGSSRINPKETQTVI